MTQHNSDGQVCGESEAQLFQVKGVTAFNVILKNSGVNVMQYRFAENNGSTWVDLGASGTDLNTTLTANQVRMFKVSSTYPNVRCSGSASGGAFLEWVVTTDITRQSGGAYTVLPV